ncbi:MAG: ABC transporter ATP-binding protein [Deltaproteobacteria bacterium]|nr:ABC transporter ATP-binding protein [Deltaproteobacteria bacterium]
MSATPVLALRDLGKRYGERVAVDGVDLVVERGEIVGLLGPNGAGKTTTISMACGVITPDRGTVHIAGHDLATDPYAAKRAIGLVPQDLALYEELTARQNLRFFGELFGFTGARLAARIDAVLAIAGLADRANEPARAFSGGMKRRLNLAIALVHEPTLLVLDEPTVGVDPQSRRHIFDAIRALRDAGLTVLYTSHYMEEVEELCDRVAIMDGGKVVASGTLRELATAHGADGLEVELAGEAAVLALAIEAALALGGTQVGERLHFDARTAWAPVFGALEATGATVAYVGSRRADLETMFLALTGKALRD